MLQCMKCVIGGWMFFAIAGPQRAFTADGPEPIQFPEFGKPKPVAVPDNVQFQQGLTYRKLGTIKLLADLAAPKEGSKNLPAIVVLHGAGGSRIYYKKVLVDLARQGYVAAAFDYRTPGTVKFPAPIHDVQTSVRWLRANSKKFRINEDRVAALGVSGGGALAMVLGMLNANDGLDAKLPYANKPYRVRAVVSCCAPTDLKSLYKYYETKKMNPLYNFLLRSYLGGPPDRAAKSYDKASPLTYARAGCAPMLFLHGKRDKIVPAHHSKRLKEKLGKLARFVSVDGDHYFFFQHDGYETAMKEIYPYLAKHLGEK